MEICKEHGEDIAYAGWGCPMCEIIDKYEDKIDDLTAQIKSLEERVNE